MSFKSRLTASLEMLMGFTSLEEEEVEEDDSVMVAAAPAPTSAAPYVFLEDAI
jgi:hypothetical protein